MIGCITAGLYGVGVVKPAVSGGTLYTGSTYAYRVFTSSDSLVVANANLAADILVVGGGAGGGGNIGGAGGGGEIDLFSSNSVTLQTQLTQ